MGLKFNPLVYAGFVPTGSGPVGPSYFGDPVETYGDLPVSGNDGEVRVVKDTGSIYMWDADDTTWELITAPPEDVQPQTTVVPDSAAFVIIPGLSLDAAVKSAQAILTITDNTAGTIENVEVQFTKTLTGAARTEERTGDSIVFDFQAQVNAGKLELFYKTQAGANTYTLAFRAITVF